ncbi:MAG: aconitase X catalytic domain-containing protein [Coriobacteriia bacterium]|nr:aconitase X catalytic domain-containing protein [Coriobacteriia bacterium]
MLLTEEQQALFDGAKGETIAKIVKTLVMYGECFGAERMVPVNSKNGHLVTSFGLSVMKPVYELMDELIAAGAVSEQPFSVDPRPLDKNVPANFLQNIFFKVMYSKQADYEVQLGKLGLMNTDAFTCTCYMDAVGNKPLEGEVLSWAESSAVVYANSVLGARCNRNSGIIELFGSIVGFVPAFGLLTDEGRKATWVVEVDTVEKPEAQVLGSAIGMKVLEEVPYVRGLDKWLGGELDEGACDYLKDMGAATASNGAVGLYHIAGLTPEAKRLGDALIAEGAQVYKVDDAELRRVRDGYPVIWKDAAAKPVLCFVGCPHLSLGQLSAWTASLTEALARNGRQKVAVPVVFTAAPKVVEEFKATPDYQRLLGTGAVVSSICPLMYMNNPLCGKKPVITSSNKLRTYTSARYHPDAEILAQIAGDAGTASEGGVS